MPTGNQRGEDQRDLIVLADDDPFDIRQQTGSRLEDGEPLAGLRGLSSYHCTQTLARLRRRGTAVLTAAAIEAIAAAMPDEPQQPSTFWAETFRHAPILKVPFMPALLRSAGMLPKYGTTAPR